MATKLDYSYYPLHQLFKERYWVDPGEDPAQAAALEEEIQTRCAQIRERIHSKRTTTEPRRRFRPYGLIVGAVALSLCGGPFIMIKLLDSTAALADVDGELAILAGVWALITLPVVAAVFLLGGMIDAERIVKWFRLAGGQARASYQPK